MIRSCGDPGCEGRVPATVVGDKNGRWDALEPMMEAYYGDEQPRFQVTPSGNRGPRQWADLNRVTRKFAVEFEDLESDGYLDIADPVDIWCLHSAYLEAISADVTLHFRAMQHLKKEFPQRGTRRAMELLLTGNDYSLHVRSGTNVDAVDGFLAAFHRDQEPEEWEVDPLAHDLAAREKRDSLMTMVSPESPLRDYYIILLYVTHDLLGRDSWDPPDHLSALCHFLSSQLLRPDNTTL